jgi:hypothetical protein
MEAMEEFEQVPIPEPMNIQQVRNIVQTEYEMIWRDWFDDDTEVQPAELVIEVGEHSPGYHHPSNSLHLFYNQGDYEDFKRKRPVFPLTKAGWFSWKGELVHEILHEYQQKRVQIENETGNQLFASFGNCFQGPGHTPAWFTAIAEKAPYFHLTIRDLLTEIGVHPALAKKLFPNNIPDNS